MADSPTPVSVHDAARRVLRTTAIEWRLKTPLRVRGVRQVQQARPCRPAAIGFPLAAGLGFAISY